MKRIIRILWIAIKNCWKSLGGYMIILLVCAGCSVAYTMIQRNMINELVASIGGEKMDIHFVFLVVIYVCVFFVYNSGGFLVTLGNNIFRFRVDALFQKFFLLQAHNLKQEMFFNSEFMDKYEFIGKNINKISTMINDLMMLLFYRGGIILGSLVLFLLYEPTMVIYMLCYTIVSMIIYRRTSRLEYDLDKKQMHEQRKSEYYRDSLMNKENAKEVRILGIKKILYNEWNQWFHNINLTKIKMQTKKTTLENVVTVIQNLLQMAGIIFITGFTLFGRIDVGTFVMLIGLLKRCSEDIDYCIGNAVKVYNSAMYICDYYEFVEPVIFFDVNESNRFLERSLQWGEFQDLSVKEVNYHYPEKLRTIENINLSIKRGEIICIIGYNGSGKTTLSKIITGSLSPQSGEIRINGHTITDADRDHVFMYFGIVPQEYARYSIQIREVVGLGDIAYIHDKNRIKESLQKVGADQWVEQFPGKEET